MEILEDDGTYGSIKARKGKVVLEISEEDYDKIVKSAERDEKIREISREKWRKKHGVNAESAPGSRTQPIRIRIISRSN